MKSSLLVFVVFGFQLSVAQELPQPLVDSTAAGIASGHIQLESLEKWSPEQLEAWFESNRESLEAIAPGMQVEKFELVESLEFGGSKKKRVYTESTYTVHYTDPDHDRYEAVEDYNHKKTKNLLDPGSLWYRDVYRKGQPMILAGWRKIYIERGDHSARFALGPYHDISTMLRSLSKVEPTIEYGTAGEHQYIVVRYESAGTPVVRIFRTDLTLLNNPVYARFGHQIESYGEGVVRHVDLERFNFKDAGNRTIFQARREIVEPTDAEIASQKARRKAKIAEAQKQTRGLLDPHSPFPVTNRSWIFTETRRQLSETTRKTLEESSTLPDVDIDAIAVELMELIKLRVETVMSYDSESGQEKEHQIVVGYISNLWESDLRSGFEARFLDDYPLNSLEKLFEPSEIQIPLEDLPPRLRDKLGTHHVER